MTDEYGVQELMAVFLARDLNDGELLRVGVAMPVAEAAVRLAHLTRGPNMELVFLGARMNVADLETIPMPAFGWDRRVVRWSESYSDTGHRFDRLKDWSNHVFFIGGIQVDRFGNINSTWIPPRPFLVGSGGGNDVASTAAENVIVATLTKQRTVAECAYVTSPGNHVEALVTDLATFEKRDGVLQVSALAPGVSFDDVRALCGWQLEPPTNGLPVLDEPTSDEVTALRRWDPRGWFLRAR